MDLVETNLREICSVIRSKQAGPFRLTLDLVFKTEAIYDYVKSSGHITATSIATLYGIPRDRITRLVFYDPGWALKISMIRPFVAGALGDGDAYGCQQHAPLLMLSLPIPSTVKVHCGE